MRSASTSAHSSAPVRPPTETVVGHATDKDFENELRTLARLAAEICSTPIGLVSFTTNENCGRRLSVVHGVESARACTRLLKLLELDPLEPGIKVVQDAHGDARLANHGAVTGDPYLRFFAATPIVNAGGETIGGLYVVDPVPRLLPKKHRQQLVTLAELASQIFTRAPAFVRTQQPRSGRERRDALNASLRAHSEIKAMYERLCLAAQVAGLGIWELDLRNQHLTWDATLFQLYEINPAEATNTYAMWRDRVHPSDVKQTEEALRNAISRGEKFSALFRVIGAMANFKWLRASGILQFDAKGMPVMMTGASWDATSVTLAEHALLSANRAAEASNRAKSEFLANMSHEIRTPLNAIIGLTELVLETRLNRQQTDYLSKVQASSKALLGILNDILDFSKIEAGRLDVEHVPFQPRIVLNAVASLFAADVEKKGLTFSLDIDPHIPKYLVGDALRLTQVLNNLVSNAIKFTAHGQIQLKAESVSTSVDAARLRFTVSDTGIGMSVEQIGKLFQAFSQADGSISRKYGGTGLGLAISQKLVVLMGGQLSLKSALGEGAIFAFDIVTGVAASELPSELASVPPGIRLAGLRVLVAEDNELNQKMVVALLQKRGAVVTVVSHGGEAVDAVRQQSFDLVLMDLNMPTMDGIEATRQIRELPQGVGLPIVAMTAAVMQADRDRCLAAGMVDFVAKPIDPDEVAATLQKWAPKHKGAKADPTSPMQALAKALRSWLPGWGTIDDPTEGPLTEQRQASLPATLPGFDIDIALKRVNGNRDLLAYLLFSFADDHADLLRHFGDLLAAGNRFASADFLHSIKGVAANLGATALADAAHQMEQQVRTGSSLVAYPAFTTAVESTLTAIKRSVRPVAIAGEPTGSADKQKLRIFLASLRPYLEAREIIPSPLIQYLRFLAQTDLPGAPLKRLIRQIDNFDHKAALASIVKLIDE